ncbi:MAG TPA: ABC transporter permease [Vicinamibacterales bacterium]|nr:ABC transporter permease [Vicinamibacterales bacterium]
MSVLRAFRKIAAALLFVALVSTAALILARRAPGDYTDTLRAARLSEDVIARERERLHLDRSLPDLTRIWLTGLARLDLGTSYRFARPVTSLIAERAPRTLALVSAAVLLAIAGALLWGTWLVHARRPVRMVLSAAATTALSLPSIVILFALLLGAAKAGWLAQAGHGMVIPLLGILALLLPAAGGLARVHEQALREALAEPWALASTARGVSAGVLVWKLAMRIAATRVISVMPLVAANILGASLLVEVVTGWAGIGRLMLDALVARDVFLVAGCTAAITAAIAALALASDALVAALDPRIKSIEALETAEPAR